MKKMRWSIVFLSVMTFLVSTVFLSYAADLSGTWNVKVEISGTTGTPVFILKEEGDKFVGTYKSQWGEFSCEGTVKGNDFEIVADVGGNKFVYKGKLDGDKMSGEANLGGQASGPFTGEREK
jgi:hypothetical protein